VGRRAKGEGSVYLHKSGSYAAQYTINGKRHTLYRGTKAEAVQAKNEAIEQANRADNPVSPKTTVAEFLETWMRDSIRPRRRASTTARYQMDIDKYIGPAIGHIMLHNLRPAHVQKMLSELKPVRPGRVALSPRTVKMVRGTLRTALNYAYRLRMLPDNIVRSVDSPTVAKPYKEALTHHDATRLLEVASTTEHRLTNLFTFQIFTGLRIGETLALRVEDIDYAKGVIHVRRTLNRRGATWSFGEPKTRSGRRDVPLTAPVIDALQAQHKANLENKLASTPGVWQEHGLVFPNSRNGNPLDATNVCHELHKLLVKAGLPSTFNVHSLRHTAATWMLEAGIQPHSVKGILGHSTIAVTMDIYSHITTDSLTDARKRIDALYVDMVQAPVAVASEV
jgi:integrase